MEFERAIAASLPAFLEAQRWFGAKGRVITGADVDDTVDLADDGSSFLAIVSVKYDEGPSDRYAMVLASREDPGRLPVIARLSEGVLVDATSDPATVAELLRGFATNSPRPSRHGGRLEYGDVDEHARRALGGTRPAIASLGADQSNTSLRIGRDFIFKIIRRLQPGENPEVEVGRYLLTRTAFRDCPPLAGSLTYHAPGSDAGFTVGVLQGWVESHGDGWAWATGMLTEALEGEIPRSLDDDIARLGRVTAEFHKSLESGEGPGFRPEPARSADFAGWTDRVRTEGQRMIELIQSKLAAWDADTQTLAALATGALDRTLPDLIAGAPATAVFLKIRIHGDYHLGQTLKTPAGFVIIDFEGQPAIPLEERKQKTCALKDVAGMLRSFDYAIETVAKGDAALAARLRERAPLRTVFLESYLDAAAALGSHSMPDRAATMTWLCLFELEKALYELEYEINNRPAWVGIPLRGVIGTLRGR